MPRHAKEKDIINSITPNLQFWQTRLTEYYEDEEPVKSYALYNNKLVPLEEFSLNDYSENWVQTYAALIKFHNFYQKNATIPEIALNLYHEAWQNTDKQNIEEMGILGTFLDDRMASLAKHWPVRAYDFAMAIYDDYLTDTNEQTHDLPDLELEYLVGLLPTGFIEVLQDSTQPKKPKNYRTLQYHFLMASQTILSEAGDNEITQQRFVVANSRTPESCYLDEFPFERYSDNPEFMLGFVQQLELVLHKHPDAAYSGLNFLQKLWLSEQANKDTQTAFEQVMDVSGEAECAMIGFASVYPRQAKNYLTDVTQEFTQAGLDITQFIAPDFIKEAVRTRVLPINAMIS